MILKSKNKNFININEIVVSNKVSFGKKGFKFFIGIKDTEKLGLYVYFFPKWVHIENTLTKLSLYPFL